MPVAVERQTGQRRVGAGDPRYPGQHWAPPSTPQYLARDERPERPGEELDDARDLVDRGDALERAVLDQARRIDPR